MHSGQDQPPPDLGQDDFERDFWRSAPRLDVRLEPLSGPAIGDDQFRLLAENIPTPCWIANGDGYIIWYNRRWHEYCGTTAGEMEGWGWQSVHDPERLPEVMERWTASVATGEPFEMTFPLRGADGVLRPFLTRIQPVRDATGAIVRWFGVNTEISAQVAAEAALRAERDRLGGILQNMTDGFVLLDRDFVVREINPESVRMEGRPREALIGRSHWEVWPGTEGSELHRLYIRVVEHGETVSMEHFFTFPEGHQAWIDMRAYPAPDGGVAIFYRDITARKESEAVSHAASLRHEALAAEQTAILGQLAEGVIVTGAGGAITFVNDAAERLHGVKRLDVAPDDYSETYHLFTEAGEPYPPAELPLTRAVRGETVVDARWRIVRPDGDEVLAIGTARPILGPDGDQTGAVLTLRDDTDRRKAEEALAARNRRLDLLARIASGLMLDKSPGERLGAAFDGIAREVDAEHYFNYLLDEAETGTLRLAGSRGLTDRQREEFGRIGVGEYLCGRVAKEQRPIILDNLDKSADPACSGLQMLGGKAYAGLPLIANGRLFGTISFCSISHTGFAEEQVALMQTVADQVAAALDRNQLVEATRESEARFREQFEHANDFIFTADLEMRITSGNPAVAAALGHRLQDLTGRSISEFVTPEMWDRNKAMMALKLNGEEEATRYEVEVFGVGGQLMTWEINSRLTRDESGAPTGLHAIARDVSDRKRAQKALQDLNETLERRVDEEVAERAKAEDALRQSQKMEAVGQLTGGIAHDFNNLLTVVIGNIDMGRRSLEASGGDARTRRALENALKGAERAASLTQRLLAFARRQPLAPKPLDLDRLVLGMSDLLNRALGEMINLEIVTTPGLWKVEADPNQLEAAILNLAVNARDAMPEGGKLSIATANASISEAYSVANAEVAPGNYVVLSAGDTGAGMARATLERVFEPFFTTKEVGKGTGLGLSQVYGFVKQSGGHITLYSEEGQGTTVKIYLPRIIIDYDLEEEQPPAPEIELSQAEETLLVVEDDDDVRAYTVELLREIGYRVLEAHDGPSALRLLDREDARIDLLFTDVVMPGMSGRALAEAARERQPNLRILYTSGYTKDAIVHGGRLDPGVDLIAKPFTYQGLARKVRDMLETGRSGRTLVVDCDPARYAAAAAALADAGYAVDRSDTVGEAIGRVRANGGRYDVVIIDTSLADRGAETLALQLRALHCDLPILLVAGEDGPSYRSPFAQDRCIGILAKPYSPEQLEQCIAALGVACADRAASGGEPA